MLHPLSLGLRVLRGLPDDLFDKLLTARADQLLDLLGGPTLIELPGRRPEPLIVTVLLHGNEDTGFEALKAVLQRRRHRELPRAMAVFIGNVAAAARQVRVLPHQRDFNRCWPGTPHPDTPEAALMREVVERLAAMRPFASIDIHNNTGINPHYACLMRVDAGSLQLARLFSRVAVVFDRPLGVQTAALAPICPSIAVECGVVGDASGTDHAAQLIESAMHLSGFPAHQPLPRDLELLRTTAIVRVPAQASFSFDGGLADIRFRADIDHMNFGEVPAGTVIGHTDPRAPTRLLVESALDGQGGQAGDDADTAIAYVDGEIRFARTVVPAMLTLDPTAVRGDCLCYLMRRIDMDQALARRRA